MIDQLIDDFLDRLASDGVALSVADQLPIVDRFVNILLSEEGKWITIGGHAKGEAKHVGGFRVQIDGDGKIIKGRLKGTNVKDVKTRFDQGKDRGTPIREKEQSSKMPSFMKNVKNTVDKSRKDDKISPAEEKNTQTKGDKMGSRQDWNDDNDIFEGARYQPTLPTKEEEKRREDYRQKMAAERIADEPRRIAAEKFKESFPRHVSSLTIPGIYKMDFTPTEHGVFYIAKTTEGHEILRQGDEESEYYDYFTRSDGPGETHDERKAKEEAAKSVKEKDKLAVAKDWIKTAKTSKDAKKLAGNSLLTNDIGLTFAEYSALPNDVSSAIAKFLKKENRRGKSFYVFDKREIAGRDA